MSCTRLYLHNCPVWIDWGLPYFRVYSRTESCDFLGGGRYWGEENYAELLEVKARYDPEGVFWCHHCVGDTEE